MEARTVGRVDKDANRPGGPISGRARIPGAPSNPGADHARPGLSPAHMPGGPTTGRATVGRAAAVSGSASVPGTGDSGEARKAVVKRAKRRRRRNITIASIAAFIMIAGIGMVAGTYYFDQVALPDDLPLKQSTTIYYSD